MNSIPTTKRSTILGLMTHVIVLTIVFILPEVIFTAAMGQRAKFGPRRFDIYIHTVMYIITFYVNYFILIDRLLFKKRTWLYLVVAALFAALIIQGIIIALNSPDYFGTMLGIGIMAQIACQTMIHIAVVTNVAPNTGISLPFFSSGGTSLVILLCEMGVMLSISRAGNAQNAARSKRSHEELVRRMNPQRRTHKALHSN